MRFEVGSFVGLEFDRPNYQVQNLCVRGFYARIFSSERLFVRTFPVPVKNRFPSLWPISVSIFGGVYFFVIFSMFSGFWSNFYFLSLIWTKFWPRVAFFLVSIKLVLTIHSSSLFEIDDFIDFSPKKNGGVFARSHLIAYRFFRNIFDEFLK